MSPEQIQGHELDPRSDIYAMGAIMYECVVGAPPFDAPNAVGILSKHLSEPAKQRTRIRRRHHEQHDGRPVQAARYRPDQGA